MEKAERKIRIKEGTTKETRETNHITRSIIFGLTGEANRIHNIRLNIVVVHSVVVDGGWPNHHKHAPEGSHATLEGVTRYLHHGFSAEVDEGNGDYGGS